MKKFALLSASLSAALAYLLPTMPAKAQFWVASNGSGTTCTRALPCNSFQAAHDAAPAGAAIKCLDSFDAVSGAGNGNLVINRSGRLDHDPAADAADAGSVVVDDAAHDVELCRGVR